MGCSGKRLLVATCRWLLVVIVGVGSFPQITCRCPNGRIKLFCFYTLFHSGNCCDASCCEMTNNENVQENDLCPSCCKAKSKLTHSNKTVSGIKSCCVRTLHIRDLNVSRTAETTVDREFSLLFLNDTLVGSMPALKNKYRSLPIHNRHAWPPPDLVTLLQHFTI